MAMNMTIVTEGTGNTRWIGERYRPGGCWLQVDVYIFYTYILSMNPRTRRNVLARRSLSIERKCYWNRPVADPICRSMCLSFRKVYCGKTVDWIRIPFGVVSGVGRRMDVLDGWWWSKGRGSFKGKRGASHWNQWGLYCAVVRERRALPKSLWEDLLLSFDIIPTYNTSTQTITTAATEHSRIK